MTIRHRAVIAAPLAFALLILFGVIMARAESGMASYYGPGFHGRTTASGERFNQNAMTCAHRTLRFGTVVTVTDIKTGRSIRCRVTDRGPFVRGRIIDLSAGAARSLGIIGRGVARVMVGR